MSQRDALLLGLAGAAVAAASGLACRGAPEYLAHLLTLELVSQRRVFLCMKPREINTDDVEAIHDFIVEAEIVEGSEELYAIVADLWPELLHKVKPPRALMH